ncbi:MAG: hypothetical protein KDD66_12660 [Bdellovibrionales bacterium]|nr:hypothetical protein [Bdellovibrionales bacterium]
MSTNPKQQTIGPQTAGSRPSAKKDWLSLSWLYPEAFGTPELVTSYNAVLVRGQSEEYKFIVPSENAAVQPKSSAFDRWLEACEEVADHRLCAPGLYKGVRALSWSDGEPLWLHEEPSMEFEPPAGNLLPSISDIAIVRARLRSEFLLENLLRKEEAESEDLSARVARSLVGFHRSSQVAAPIDQQRAVHAGEKLKNESRANCRNLLAQTAPGSILEFVCQELMSHLQRFFSSRYGALGSAAKQGAVIDCHGALEMGNIAFDPFVSPCARPMFFGRPGRLDNARINYTISDVASLYLDMSACGFNRCARVLLQEYFDRAPETKDSDLLRSLIVWSAIRRSSQIADECSLEPCDEQERVTSLLATAYRILLELAGPRIILIAGVDAEQEILTQSVAELTNADIVHIAGKPSEHSSQLDSAQLTARSLFRQERPLVLSASTLSRPLLEFSIGMGRLHSLAATNILLNKQIADRSSEENEHWRSFAASSVVELEASLPLPEMCREILYTIRHQ